MENIYPLHLQEIIFGSSDARASKQTVKLVREGRIRKIAPRIYTSNLNDKPEEIIRRNLFQILGKLYPGAVLSHRSAFEFRPTRTGQVFLTYKYTRKVNLPGITIRFLRGSGPTAFDYRFFGGLWISDKPRAFLENLQISKKAGEDSKCLPIAELEEKLDKIIRLNGEEEINKLRDNAREVALALAMEKEFALLNKMIAALLSTHPSGILSSPVALARSFGFPYDPERMTLFEGLFRELQATEFRFRPERNTGDSPYRNFAFFESYFSNYIEGTVFEIAEAREIIRSNRPLPARSDDSHDILGTYRLVASREEMSVSPASPEELLKILAYRHGILLIARSDKNPGLFKDKNNYAGNTAFVDFNLVKGTLIHSFDYFKALNHPFSRAAFMMFVISEVHPFLDGNGRIARVMMNAELVKAGQSKIIIPTVYREDYLGALKKLTKAGDCGTYIRMLQRAQEFSENITGNDIDEMEGLLRRSNAFSEPSEAKLRIIQH